MSNLNRELKGKHSVVIVGEEFVEKRIKKEFYSNFLREKLALQRLKKYDFVPKLISYDEKNLSIKMEKVQGINLLTIIKLYKNNRLGKELILYIFKNLFKICFFLDVEGVYKDEWNRPFKHIIITEKNIKVIDFDRSLFNTSRKNVLQFLSFVFGFWNFFGQKGNFRHLYDFCVFYGNQIERYQKFR
ncbi:MAG: hypothetical protein N2657_06515 [bacterium]|nr:hypothetical protein [bacterium]